MAGKEARLAISENETPAQVERPTWQGKGLTNNRWLPTSSEEDGAAGLPW